MVYFHFVFCYQNKSEKNHLVGFFKRPNTFQWHSEVFKQHKKQYIFGTICHFNISIDLRVEGLHPTWPLLEGRKHWKAGHIRSSSVTRGILLKVMLGSWFRSLSPFHTLAMRISTRCYQYGALPRGRERWGNNHGLKPNLCLQIRPFSLPAE